MTNVSWRLLGFVPLAHLLFGASFVQGNDEQSTVKPEYSKAVEQVGLLARSDPWVSERLDFLLAEADRICEQRCNSRVFSLAELRQKTDGRSGAVESRVAAVEKVHPDKAELFALASADVDVATKLFRELPLLAAAYRLTGRKHYQQRIEAQLHETLNWKPLQRPGWTLFQPQNNLPPTGNDGVWLSTGLGLVALVQTLQIVKPGLLPADLEAAVREQIKYEVEKVRADWEKQVPWYVRARNVTTNQWVTPAGGLVVASAFLGRDTVPEAYELGVSSILATMDALGADGSTSEGGVYGIQRTLPFLYLAARAAKEAGDDRLISHPFLRNSPAWISSVFQPGDHVINCFDGYDANRGSQPLQLSNFTLLATLSRSPSLLWILRHVFESDMLSLDLYGLLALEIPASQEKEPPLYGVYESSAWVSWRDSWKKNASGVWIRGGHRRDFHDHNDRGHVNFIADGKAVLIEAGTPGYSDPEKVAEFNSVKGHNVLQIDDELLPRKRPAVIKVHRLDATGGDVTIDAGAGYREGTEHWEDGAGKTSRDSSGAVKWVRRVVWDARNMTVTDRVTLVTPGIVLFRWHLGSEQPLQIEPDSPTSATVSLQAGVAKFPGWITRSNVPKNAALEGVFWKPPLEDIVETPSARINVTASQAVQIKQEKNLDHTFKYRIPRHAHTTLVVKSLEKISTFEMTTKISSP